MVRIARRPQSEAVVMLAHQNDLFSSRILHSADPLFCIKLRGIENRGILATISPLHAPERIGTEVQEEGLLVSHPGCLVGTRQNLRGLLGDRSEERRVGKECRSRWS